MSDEVASVLVSLGSGVFSVLTITSTDSSFELVNKKDINNHIAMPPVISRNTVVPSSWSVAPNIDISFISVFIIH